MTEKLKILSLIKAFLFHEGVPGFLIHLLLLLINCILLYFGISSVLTFDVTAGIVILLGVVILNFFYFKKRIYDFDFDRRMKKRLEEESSKDID